MLQKPISVLLPGTEVREAVGPTRFVYGDNRDEELRFQVSVTYSDVTGKTYEEDFVVDLASQKGRMEYEDIEGKNRYRLLRGVEEGVRSLAELVRVLDSPDRSNLFTPVDSSALDSSHIDLLSRLLDACDNEPSGAMFMVHNLVTGPEIRKCSPDKPEKIEGSMADVQYLCRTGALNGY